MTLKDQVLAQALMLTSELSEQQTNLLELLCASVTATLIARLREGLTPNDCKADFIAAGSLYALAALDSATSVEEFKAGDLTVRRQNTNAAASCLFNQAELMIAPYLKDRFSFMGV